MMKVGLTLSLISAIVALVHGQGLSFVSIGDWGCGNITDKEGGNWHFNDEKVVAKAFAKTATDLDAKFVVNTGDNFYYCGVTDVHDAAWQYNFENVFTEPSMQVPWISCLGNHDYGFPGSADAQTQYTSPNNNRWVLPSRYFLKRLSYPQVNITFIVLDASPCQQVYRSSDPSGWDPCGSVIPACPGCTFHQNVLAQNCGDQVTWLQQVIPTIDPNDWKIALVHAPANEIDVEDLVSLLQQARVDLYLNGHVHTMAYYTVDGNGTYITTGAGCMVRVPKSGEETSQEDELRLLQSTRGHQSMRAANPKKVGASCQGNRFHTCQTIMDTRVAGYTSHTFSADYTQLTTDFYKYDGSKFYTVTTNKGGNTPTPPGPAPSPPPGSECCYYDDEKCDSGMICCAETGKSYTEKTCEGKYGQKHHCSWTGDSCVVP